MIHPLSRSHSKTSLPPPVLKRRRSLSCATPWKLVLPDRKVKTRLSTFEGTGPGRTYGAALRDPFKNKID